MTAKHSKVKGRAMAFMSARGGVGKTSLSAQAALLCAQAGLATALLDLDIQFGDIDFIFDQLPRCTLLDLCMESNLDVTQIPRFAHEVAPNLDLFISGCKPEHADLVVPHAATLVHALRLHYDMVVINTGSFWSTLQAEIAEEAIICFLVFNARAISLRTTLRVRELFNRLGIPASKIAYLMNHIHAKNEIELFDASMVLGTTDIAQIPYGGVQISDLMSIGRAHNLIEESSTTAVALETILYEKNILPTATTPMQWVAEEPVLVGEQR